MTQDRTIGIIGGGQLARMLFPAAISLGLRIRLLSESADSAAAQVIPDTVVGDVTDPATVRAFAASVATLTFDHEHVPTDLLHELEASGVTVRPGPSALVHAQDKAVMRARLTALGVPCPRWRLVTGPAELKAFGDETGWPVIAKVTRGGYDGKGVWRLDSAAEAGEPFAGMAPGVPLLAEECVPFVRELSALVVRRPGGATVAYPVSESVQREGICHETLTPAPGLDPIRERAIEQLALGLAGELGVVGVLAVELMERPDGEVVVNELAMRPHNTGHWSLGSARTSQFENHLRAVADLPLGPATLRAPYAVMRNVLGAAGTDLDRALPEVLARCPGAWVELYGKTPRPGRKLGHVTADGDDLARVRGEAETAARMLADPGRTGAA